ncbi:MAG: nucleotidyl transferase AbiEii/AbiGii toxin family protein [Dysgonomonas sp.]|uniref:nucleotidyl transferase AbiEii/AbiGii toxin family protein n=1 Tax=Dysgonomonas sp. TaxID=1891233 RepID=UPI0039E50394
MKTKLYYNTIKEELHTVLTRLMSADEFEAFRLVGGTSLSLQLGHRISVDMDLFTDAGYKSIDFDAIDTFLHNNFPYVDSPSFAEVAFGKSYYVGQNADRAVKVDLYYTDPYIRPAQQVDGIRMAHIEDIAAMKLEVVGNGGRKKDFWDLDELSLTYSLEQMLGFYEERYPYSYTKEDILKALVSFELADEEADPVSLRDKPWQLIKLDIEDRVKQHRNKQQPNIQRKPPKRGNSLKM